MVKKWKVNFPSPDGPEQNERYAYVYLPDSYFEPNSTRRYPVLYMFDGHNVFFNADATYGKCWGMKEYMDRTKTQMIIAAVECNHSANNGRLLEYSPFDFDDPQLGQIEGHGQDTMEWFVNVFKKEIDANYRTLPDRKHTFIAGSSMGGLMSLYAVLKYNHVFSGAACLSPSVWTNTRKINRMIDDSRLHPQTTIYLDYGSREIGFHPVMKRQFSKVISILMEKNVFVNSRIVPNGDHCEACWEKQIPFFMNTLLYRGYR